MKKRICDITVEVLRETDNPAVMWGDCGLLDLIAERAPGRNKDELTWEGHRRILNALSRQPGILIKKRTMCWVGNRECAVRIFRLPEDEVLS